MYQNRSERLLLVFCIDPIVVIYVNALNNFSDHYKVVWLLELLMQHSFMYLRFQKKNLFKLYDEEFSTHSFRTLAGVVFGEWILWIPYQLRLNIIRKLLTIALEPWSNYQYIFLLWSLQSKVIPFIHSLKTYLPIRNKKKFTINPIITLSHSAWKIIWAKGQLMNFWCLQSCQKANQIFDRFLP